MKQSKLIAEPWDVGYGGYQVGGFPPGWAEWNDKFRDVVRRFWKGDLGQTPELASRIAGSSDVFNYNNRDIWASVNFITAHDGFTLRDLVSYNGKHNNSNGEENRDGSDSNWSWNSGAEGESDNKTVTSNRYARGRALMATLLLSFGTPMMLAGDEFAHTQFGNNNPYCQDNVLTWIAWEAITDENRSFARFVKNWCSCARSSEFSNAVISLPDVRSAAAASRILPGIRKKAASLPKRTGMTQTANLCLIAFTAAAATSCAFLMLTSTN